MAKYELIIALTEHRYLGMIFQPFFIQQNERFYSVVRMVKMHDLDDADYVWKPYEKELVKYAEKYSDNCLVKKFSRASNVSEFFATLRDISFEKQVKPYIEKWMLEIVSVLMLCPVRLFKKEAKYANLYDEDKIEVSPFFAHPKFYFERTQSETRYHLKVVLQEKEILLSKQLCTIITEKPCLLLYKNQLVLFKQLNAKRLLPFFEKDFVAVPNSIEEKYYSGFILKTIRDFEVKASGFEIVNSSVNAIATLSLQMNLQNRPCFVLTFDYGQEHFELHSEKKVAIRLQKKGNSFVFYKTMRNLQWEKQIFENLVRTDLIEKNGCFSLKGMELLKRENAIHYLVNWLGDKRLELEEKDIKIKQELSKHYYTGGQELELKAQSKGDWFDVYAIVHFGEFQIPFIKLKEHILNDIREFELPNGEIAILPDEWFTQFKGLLPFGKENGKQIQFKKYHFALLQDTIQEADKSILQKYQQLINTNQEKVSLPTRLNATLRNYQAEGFGWMYTLFRNGFGGCLADDMGLGKTLQTLTLLLKLKRLKQEINVCNRAESAGQMSLFSAEPSVQNIQPASLIVVPTSLVHNWLNEIAKFTPALKVYSYVGAQRKKVASLQHIASFYDVIITTYGTVRNDSELLSQSNFFYLILDESQSIKNSKSKTYKAIMKLQSSHRLVITGTPIENSLSDLWAQMNFLNPGMLGNLTFFRRTFITPIEKHANQEQADTLKLMIRPFVLRRKKADVAKDLPPLVEQVRICSMLEYQKKKYEEEKSIIRNTILSAIEDEGLKKSQFILLQGLTKLRQLANHPALIESSRTETSGKFETIIRMLKNLVAENHKVLIFSSFVKHLALLQEKIEEQQWKFSKLTGKTRKREQVIRAFQEDETNPIFLISLKAGGVGLNLTEADYVFILDPWWNPAVENQAINRSHRIGQDKHVFVYRFITENSIEEKIQQLKERKSLLADKFINANNPFEKITKEEVLELLR